MAVNPFSSGPPHVRPIGMHRTCGEPDETKKNTHPKNITALFRLQGEVWKGTLADADNAKVPEYMVAAKTVRTLSRSILPRWASIRFRLAPRTYLRPMGRTCGA